MLVAQVTLYQTVRNAVRRVASVLAGVLVAVAFSALIGFTWWSLGITIVAAGSSSPRPATAISARISPTSRRIG